MALSITPRSKNKGIIKPLHLSEAKDHHVVQEPRIWLILREDRTLDFLHFTVNLRRYRKDFSRLFAIDTL